MRKRKKIELPLPRWFGATYVCCSLALLPWTAYLGDTLPEHHLSAHWDLSWTGLNAVLFIALFATGILAYKKSRWVATAASTTGALLFADAWFDVMSERNSFDFRLAVVLALFVELPLALFSYYIAYKALHKNIA